MTDVYGYQNLIEVRADRIVVPHPGVVLIDEMDSHLHPEWQRSIGFWLKERFPEVQFIVTTHSPMICQAADENGIFHLPSPGAGHAPFRVSADDYRKIISSKADAILVSPAFGMEYTRSPLAVASMRKIADLRAKATCGTSRAKRETGAWSSSTEVCVQRPRRGGVIQCGELFDCPWGKEYWFILQSNKER